MPCRAFLTPRGLHDIPSRSRENRTDQTPSVFAELTAQCRHLSRDLEARKIRSLEKHLVVSDMRISPEPRFRGKGVAAAQRSGHVGPGVVL